MNLAILKDDDNFTQIGKINSQLMECTMTINDKQNFDRQILVRFANNKHPQASKSPKVLKIILKIL